MDAQGKETAKELSEVIHESGKEYNSKQTLGAFNFKSKKLSTKVFANAQKNLQRLKDIKKEYAAKQKKEEEAKKATEGAKVEEVAEKKPDA